MMQRNMIQEVNIYLAPKHGLADFLLFDKSFFLK